MNSTRPSRLALAAAALAVALTACAAPAAPSSAPVDDAEPVIEVHRSPTCACCGEYERYLRGEGFTVRPAIRDDMDALKEQHRIGSEHASCHTAFVDGYFVEGHVPVEVIRTLLETRPDVDGITLPGMPSGAPGMNGEKAGPLTVYSLTDGVADEFATS